MMSMNLSILSSGSDSLPPPLADGVLFPISWGCGSLDISRSCMCDMACPSDVAAAGNCGVTTEVDGKIPTGQLLWLATVASCLSGAPAGLVKSLGETGPYVAPHPPKG